MNKFVKSSYNPWAYIVVSARVLGVAFLIMESPTDRPALSLMGIYISYGCPLCCDLNVLFFMLLCLS